MVTQHLAGNSKMGSFNVAKGSFAAIHPHANNRNLSSYSAKPILSPSNVNGRPQENLFHMSRQ
jgi:hypothetical protein